MASSSEDSWFAFVRSMVIAGIIAGLVAMGKVSGELGLPALLALAIPAVYSRMRRK